MWRCGKCCRPQHGNIKSFMYHCVGAGGTYLMRVCPFCDMYIRSLEAEINEETEDVSRSERKEFP